MNTADFAPQYSEPSLWKKLADFATTAGKEVVEKVLVLFETLKDADTPRWAKGVIVAALGYFISPIDAIPDLLPFAGYADDLGVLAAALATVVAHIKPQHKAAAQATLARWFSGRKSMAQG